MMTLSTDDSMNTAITSFSVHTHTYICIYLSIKYMYFVCISVSSMPVCLREDLSNSSVKLHFALLHSQVEWEEKRELQML